MMMIRCCFWDAQCKEHDSDLDVREPDLTEYFFPDFDMGFVPDLWPVAYTQVGL